MGSEMCIRDRINGAMMLVLGLLPGGLMALCVQAIRSSLSL